MEIDELTIDARRLWPGEMPWEGPLAFIDLEGVTEVPDEIVLPPCPVVGIGDGNHPLAKSLDAVVEPPVSAEALAKQVLDMPRSAAIVVQLLRILPSLSLEDGLTVESMAYAVLQGSEEHIEWIAARKHHSHPERTPGEVTLVRERGRLIVTLDHPDSGNAIDRHMRDQLYDAFALAALDPEIAQVSLRATGRTFSLGAELGEFGTTTDPATTHSIRCRTLPARMVARCADRLDVHVQGGCVGSGLELAAYASRFTAARDAWFHLPELSMGILPGAGGCVSLTRRIGRQRAALLILSGKRLRVSQALAWGLVDEIVDDPA
ncbi:MAG: enoyl-CoA hydratase/isomerase family protein [Novosphingobium sp.]|nr:enoyl-CoA hydratase/isomerase family protein [Novosphingobium sp.]